MKRPWVKLLTMLVGILVLAAAFGFLWVRREYAKMESDDPGVWEPVIADFEAEDRSSPVPRQAVLFVGSSSIRFWNSLAEDMHPVPVIRRGFGGAKLQDVSFYADRIIFPYRPKAIVLFAGSNDISGRPNDKTPEQVAGAFRRLAEQIRHRLPDTPLYYLAITPTRSRWEVWPKVQRANRLIERYCRTQQHLFFIDTTRYFLTKEGRPNEDLLWWDGTHLNRDGYAIWTRILKARLLKEIYGQP
ncbi:GDSL-type esterase/lipase family protein [Larkinella soli]|uniref:GDSL-type esterase/lipase family protein n=1 Tax=Larkinella soli TaxID=1770527 RepID=UPI000FFC7290|nr:GDSL-type esterase/lipase family protein [Larkinella soli]